jgi:integrase
MAPRGLTPIGIAALKPRAKRYEVPDRGCVGLYVVVQPVTGKKSFALRYRRPNTGRPAKLTLGNGSMTLAEARKAAAAALDTLAKGVDPGTAKLDEAKRAALAKADTLAAIAEQYLKREAEPKLRTAGQRRNTFERLIYPTLGAKPIAEIKRSDIVRLLDKVEDSSGPRMADECLMAVRRVMNWHATRSDDFRSPIVRGMSRSRPAAERARDRVLTDDELRKVWHAADGGMFGSFVRFLILTSARRNEAARMRWSEIEGLDWTLPAARNKTKQDLVRPLSAAALAVLASVPRIDGCEYVFSNGRTPLANFSRDKRALDAASGTSGWTLHDLRRTARSLLSRAGVNADHAERCLGHVIGGVRGVYDRHAFHAEKKHALAALAAQIERIVNPPADVVVPLRGQ